MNSFTINALSALSITQSAIDEIDWQEVAAIVRQGLIILAVALITITIISRELLITTSERLGHWYARIITAAATAAPAAPVAATAPFVHPLYDLADDVARLTRRQLQAAAGVRRNLGKRQLIALYLAA